jgi:hypothetical protein
VVHVKPTEVHSGQLPVPSPILNQVLRGWGPRLNETCDPFANALMGGLSYHRWAEGLRFDHKRTVAECGRCWGLRRHRERITSGAFYGEEGLSRLAAHLHPRGVFGLWSNDRPDGTFTARLCRVFSDARAVEVTFHNPLQDKPFTQTVYLATKPVTPSPSETPSGRASASFSRE